MTKKQKKTTLIIITLIAIVAIVLVTQWSPVPKTGSNDSTAKSNETSVLEPSGNIPTNNIISPPEATEGF